MPTDPRVRAQMPCNAREPAGVWRCEEKKGHYPNTPHCVETPAGTITWGDDFSDAMPRTRSVNSTLKDASVRSIPSESFTDGIKAKCLSDQLLIYGYTFCVRCKKPLNTRRLTLPIDVTSGAIVVLYRALLEEAMTLSAKHHLDGRRSHGYAPAKHGYHFGHDDPLLIEAPLCHDCHTGPDSEIHPGPQFGVPVEVASLESDEADVMEGGRS